MIARKGDTPEYVHRMQQDLFDVLAQAPSREELQMIKSKAVEVRAKYMRDLKCADVRELAVHRRLSRINYSRRCAESSALRTYRKRGLSLAPGMEIGYAVTDAVKLDVDTERDALEFDAGYYGKLLEKAWDEVGFVLQ
jgi:DNA polymerase I